MRRAVSGQGRKVMAEMDEILADLK